MIRLSKNFLLSELTHTDTGLKNDPTETQGDKLLYLTNYILQPIRNKFGSVRVTSGFRSEAVNNKIGGSSTSQHVVGEAADIIPDADIDEVFRWIVYNITFGQAIKERAGSKRWIHISLPRIAKPNQVAMIYREGEYIFYEEDK